jgi:hypothetical protein
MASIIFLFMILLGMGSLVATIWAAIEIGTKPFVREKDKVLWLIIVLMLGIIGPIIYFTQRRNLLAEFAEPDWKDDVLDINAPRPQKRERGGSSTEEDYFV